MPTVAIASVKSSVANTMTMIFELIDRYLLDGTPARPEVVRAILSEPSSLPAALPFYEGMRILGGRTPDLSLIALRLVLAGKRADDAAVVKLRDLASLAKRGGEAGASARSEYRAALE
ncbi:MAG: hypothetical protein M3N13_00765 [Candidatus Eremiobacteraeota bacterium]|nr:hypothetical protein [Candidatus Eremiobacteraeota bacterium]